MGIDIDIGGEGGAEGGAELNSRRCKKRSTALQDKDTIMLLHLSSVE
jgi:hypothetical protein